MISESRQYKLERAFVKDVTDWVAENCVFKCTIPLDPQRELIFFNPITKKLTGIPKAYLSKNTLYFPTNSPGTGETYVMAIFAVNGSFDINYDECDNRFGKDMEYYTGTHKTRLDIFVCRQADRKADAEKEEKDGE